MGAKGDKTMLEYNLMSDLLFKETFANTTNRKQLEHLLELLLEYPEGYLHNKLDVKYESPLAKGKHGEKSVRGDIVVSYDDVTINIEAYRIFDKLAIDKSLYYIMRIYSGKLNVGDDYSQIGKIFQINFVEQTSLDIKDTLVANFYLIWDKDLNTKMAQDNFCVKVVQIDKARELGYTKNELEKWLQYIGTPTPEGRSKVAKGDELLMELNEWFKKYVNDKETVEMLNKWDMQIERSHSFQEGSQQKSIEIAKNMLSLNMAIEDISKVTGLSKTDIEKL